MRRKLGFVGRIMQRALKSAGISWSDEAFWSTWTPQGSITPAGYSDMKKAVGDGTALDVIMAPVMWVARRMAESPVGVTNIADPSIDFQHSAAKLLKRPNPWYAGSTMRMAMSINYLMDGNAYLRKVRDKFDSPYALVFIPSWTIEPIPPPLGKGGYIDQYMYNPGGIVTADQQRAQLIDARDIIHLRYGIDPNFTRKGISPLKILMREVYTDVQGATMTAMMLKNAGLFGVVISPKTLEGVTVSKPTETKKYIEEEFNGVRLGKPMVFSTPTDVSFLGLEQAKFDMGALRGIPEERVCALLNIPSAVVGFGTGMKQTKVGATLVELRAMAYEDCVIPTQNSWCDEFDLQMMPDFEPDPENWHCQFDNSDVRVLQDDENRISDRMVKQLVSGGILLSEFREEMGYEVDEATQEIFYVPSIVTPTPAEEINAPPAPPPQIVLPGPSGGPNAEGGLPTGQEPSSGPNAEGQSPAGKSLAERNEVRLKKRRAARKDGLHGSAKLTAKLSRFIHAQDRAEKRTRKVWAGELTALFKVYGEHVAETFQKTAERHGAKNMPREMLKEDAPDWAIIAGEALIDAGDIAGLVSSFGGKYLAIAKATYGNLDSILGLGVMLDDPTEQTVLQLAGKRMGLVDFTDQARQAMFDTISAARETGAGAAEIARQIADSIAAGPWGSAETRAMVIARTETKYAQNSASLAAYAQSENVTDVLVFDAQLGPTDEECEALNGETVSLSEAEILMESEHPNGTRSFAPVIGGQ